MNEKKLKKLSRLDLVELLMKSSKRVEELEQRVADLERLLDEHTIICEESGNIADAAVQVNELLVVAQRTAEDYVRNVKQMTDRKYGEDGEYVQSLKKRLEEELS